MKKCFRFTKELTTKMCSHFPYLFYLNYSRSGVLSFDLVYVRIVFFHFSDELKCESEARNYIVIARITLRKHVGLHVYFHCL
jgi:hypothetical protein